MAGALFHVFTWNKVGLIPVILLTYSLIGTHKKLVRTTKTLIAKPWNL
jgi:hypothetical protein